MVSAAEEGDYVVKRCYGRTRLVELPLDRLGRRMDGVQMALQIVTCSVPLEMGDSAYP